MEGRLIHVPIEVIPNKRANQSNDTPSKHTKLEIKITDVNRPYQAEDADVILVCSDELIFKTHKSTLLVNANIFDYYPQELDVKDNNVYITIEFNDDDETSFTIRIFLDLIYGRSIPTPIIGSKYEDSYLDVIIFIKHHHVDVAIERLKATFKAWANEADIDLLKIFLYGAKIRDPKVCMAVISSRRDRWWADEVGVIPDRHVLDLQAGPIEIVENIPIRYQRALDRVSFIVGQRWSDIWSEDGPCKSRDWLSKKDKIAKEFEKLLREWTLPEE